MPFDSENIIDGVKGLFGVTAREREKAERLINELKEEANKARKKASEDLRREAEATESARAETRRTQEAASANEAKLKREASEQEAKLKKSYAEKLEDTNEQNRKNMQEMNTASKKREEETHRKHEEKLEKERREAQEREDKRDAEFSAAIKQKNREILAASARAHEEMMSMMNKNSQEKAQLHKEHMANLVDQQRRCNQQQQRTQEMFELERSALQAKAMKREEAIWQEKAEAQREFQRQIAKSATQSKEERERIQTSHDASMKKKDQAIADLRTETEERVEQLHEQNRLQQERDLATLKNFGETMLQREREVHSQHMAIERERQEERAGLYEQMLERDKRNHAQVMHLQLQLLQEIHMHSNVLLSLPRAMESERETDKLHTVRERLFNEINDAVEPLIELDAALGDYTTSSSEENANTVEKVAEKLNDGVKKINKAALDAHLEVGKCTSVAAATREKWRVLMVAIQTETSNLTRSSTKLLHSARRKELTLESITAFGTEVDKIRSMILTLPVMVEESALGIIQQGMAEVARRAENSAAMGLRGKGRIEGRKPEGQ